MMAELKKLYKSGDTISQAISKLDALIKANATKVSFS